MDFFEIEPYRLAGGHHGKWALTLTRVRVDEFGVDEQPFYGGPVFGSEKDALRYGVRWVTSRGGRVRETILRRLSHDDVESERNGELR
jgi:hypothetical protein